MDKNLAAIAAIILLVALAGVGWCMNVWKLCHDDFASPYKAEVVRTIGIFIPPVGSITGYVAFDEENK